MNVAARKQPPTVRLRRLAAEIRALRHGAGLTREDVAERTHMNPATLWRLETARARPQRRTLLGLLDVYGVTDPERRAELVDLAKDAGQLGWLQAYEDQLPDEYSTYISFESEAQSVRNYESLFVPGLLQTEAYARALIAGVLPEITEDEVERRVEARLKRQEVLARAEPLRVWAIIDESVLHRRVGSAEVIRDQLQHLAKLTRVPNITVQVLPYDVGAHPGMHGAFAIMGFPDSADPELVYLENRVNGLFLERDTDIASYTDLFEHLRAAALNPAASVRMVSRIADQH
ncbi:helix-turn-helix transcriptional regulator [Plantactinospora sp. KLBMP9567]|uniref:helix-turn-helix domain-containing protein n=1 Tax=Plantactinospora sp. KLBMP9567 TaxID=3085900 RepID=UPI0029810720|nr:helix-turn-helix transcriptional regulator [Plantactinospora sp. KLBMP9567]MDW5329415.1 helix-turn-helix transcriptional regulator [Plantactinospora sp. KLBMP9567]